MIKGFWVILRFELFALFVSPATYVASFYFLALLGVGFRFFIESFVLTDWILPPLASLVVGLVFGAPALIPFLTMRSFAEERRLGTLETLMSAPVSNLGIVLGKWTASYLFFIFITMASFCFPLIISLCFPEQSQSLGFDKVEQWIGAFSFLLIFGASFSAVGIFASSVTNNQMVAGMLTFTLLTLYLSFMIFYFGENIEFQFFSGFAQIAWSIFGAVFGGLNKMQYFSVGIIDIPTVLYQMVVTFYFLILASTQIDQVKK
jgi:ABC-2 type transport system permease protein